MKFTVYNLNYKNCKKKFCFWLFVFGFLFLNSCSSNQSTPTQGKQKIVIDESFQPMFEAEIEMFESLYKESNIKAIYKPEGEIINDFFKDTCRYIIIGRDLTQKEKDFFASKKSFPISTRVAVDALAFITNKNNPVQNLTFNELKEIFEGKKNQWKEFDSSIKDKSLQDTSITIVFDNEKSCNVRMLKEKLLNGGDFPKNCFAVKSDSEVVGFVGKHKNALGIIGVNWISDKNDTLTRTFLSEVNVLGVSSEENPGDFFQPYQAYIHSREYPFNRDVYIINREGRTGLGTGFAAFVASDKGQLIILKAGMVPATMPIRTVEIKTQ